MAYLSRFLTNKVAPIKVAAFKSMDKCFCGGNVGCNRNVVNVAKTKKGCVIRIVVLVHRITEEKQKIDLVAGNSGSCKCIGKGKDRKRSIFEGIGKAKRRAENDIGIP